LKKKIIIIPTIIFLAVCLLLVIVNLSKKDFSRDEILIGGSTTVLQYTQLLADEFMKQNDGVRIISEGGGSTPGLIAVKNEAIDIASMSRDLESNEDDDYTNNYLIGKDGVGIVVNPANPVLNLSIQQVRDIFSGKISSWRQISNSGGKIKVICRPSESTTLKGLNEIVMKGEQFAADATIADSAEDLAKDVAIDPNAIGFLALKDVKTNIKLLKINGIELTRTTILSDRYPLTRSFYFVLYDKPGYKINKVEDNSILSKITGLFGNDEENTQQSKKDTIFRFLQFVQSKDGQKILEKNGAVSVY
jgi:phosphate transport system substrate-binding protein